MNNSVFGKTMENVRLRLKMELTSSEARYRKLVNLPNHKGTTIYGDNLCAVHLHKDDLVFDKPMYIGFAVLDISKTLMYDFHYGTMKALYGENIELLYMDTDSLIYLVKTKNFYEDMEHNRGFLEKLDTSNYPVNHPCYRTERCKIPGTFTDETGGEIISAHVALRSKAYGFIQNTKEIIKAKGVAHHAVKNHIIFENYKQCLFQGIIDLPEDYTPYREMRSFRSYKHQIKVFSK
ncbi:uncharacterized protein LOC126898042 [Daktulosphaira vitifoliae]|uniref:uncharacterized protein LOC126898042 n=1 Tax=Daktulosphaira vitifoliae TaxID=58002 RepID=UPI0021AA02E5|nr:uncharacterized protein LOC126898042 [Daktulosphaira vitifoliae]